MKKLFFSLVSIFFALLLLLFITPFLLTQDKSLEAKAISDSETQSLFEKGVITIKLKEGIGDFDHQKGKVVLNISSLDLKMNQFEVDRFEKRFKYDQKKMKKAKSDLSRIYKIQFPEEYSVTKVAREFSKAPNIEYAEPIPVVHLLAEPNDAMYGDLHHLSQIHAEEAWDIHKGENGPEDIIIAIVDSGTEWDHEDLVDNIWQNMGEDFDGDGKTIEFTGGEWIFDPDDENGVDDDENGYVDDFIGWNFFLNNNDPNPVPGTYMSYHGTLMGGYASATTDNNVGVSSISWNLKILPIQAGWESEMLQSYNAMIYAAENGADIITNSWGHYDFYSQAHQEAISYVRELGSIVLGGAANSDQFRIMYPAAYPGVLGVAALNRLDNKAYYSNFGPHIDISAPGGDGAGSDYQLLTTAVNNSYESASGTSCATPIVAGLLGLVKSYHPEWTSDQVITQVLGTADGIDDINPGFENQLGVGRINAYRALDESNVTLQQEIALDLFFADFEDSDDNHLLEPGDTARLNLKLRNYTYGVGAENATFKLIANDPEITILNDTYTFDIPADDHFTLENAFEFKLSDQATPHLANFILESTCDKEITWGATISLDVIVAPSGILVYQGEGLGNAYSGDYINEFLNEQGQQVLYTSHFPSSLIGFDAVFLSFGNHGVRLRDGTAISMEMTQIISEYLHQGGRIYIECGSFISSQYYFGYPDYEEVMNLLGIGHAFSLAPNNPLTLLSGTDNSICQNLEFAGSTQNLSWFIDAMTPNENGKAAFEEDDYGTVAVQGEGVYGQKSFCFSYALAHLVDNESSSRDELLQRIYDFLFLHLETDEIASVTEPIEVSLYPNPFSGSTTFEYELSSPGMVQITFFDQFGKQVDMIEQNQSAGLQQLVWTTDLPGGIFYFRLEAGEQIASGKVVLVR